MLQGEEDNIFSIHDECHDHSRLLSMNARWNIDSQNNEVLKWTSHYVRNVVIVNVPFGGIILSLKLYDVYCVFGNDS